MPATPVVSGLSDGWFTTFDRLPRSFRIGDRFTNDLLMAWMLDA